MLEFETGEYVIHVARKHWFVFAIRLVTLFILSLMPLLTLPLLSFVPDVSSDKLASMAILFTFLYMLFLLIVWMVGFLIWTDYYLDIFIITNKRIIEVEQKGLFSREVSTMRYEMIQDVTSDISGVIPTLLDYGDLSVQTAATTRQFFLDRIANPNQVKELLQKQIKIYKNIRHGLSL